MVLVVVVLGQNEFVGVVHWIIITRYNELSSGGYSGIRTRMCAQTTPVIVLP